MSEYLFHCYIEDCPPEEALPPEQRHVLTPAAVLHTPSEVVEWLESIVVSMYGADTDDDKGDIGYWREEWLRQAECGSLDMLLALGGDGTVTVVPVRHPVQNMHWHIYHEEVHFSKKWTDEQRRRRVPDLMCPDSVSAAEYLGRVAALFHGVDEGEYFEANHEEIGFWENQLVTMRRVFSFSQGPELHVTIDTFDGPDCHLCPDAAR